MTLLFWSLVAGSATFWFLQLRQMPLGAATADVAPVLAPQVDAQRMAHALGASDPDAAPTAAGVNASPLAERLQLLGVLTRGAGGAALVSVDGGPARPVRVGQTPADLDGGWVLHAVAPHAATFAADQARVQLHMPELTERSRAGDAVAPDRSAASEAVPTPVRELSALRNDRLPQLVRPNAVAPQVPARQ